jgi:hypothetical protein
VLAELRNMGAGCDWIITKFRWLKATLEERGWWYPSEKDLAFHLFGRRPSDAFSADTFASELLDAYVVTAWTVATPSENWRKLGITQPETLSSEEFQLRLKELVPELYRSHDYDLLSLQVTREQLFARKEVNSMIDAELERLIFQRDQIREIEQHDRADARAIAAFDATPEGTCRLRYEMAHRRTLHVALADLVKQKALTKDDPDIPEPLEPTQIAPLLDVTLLSEPDHFVDPRPRPMGSEVRIDRPRQSEPITVELRERKPLVRSRFRDAVRNVAGTGKAPDAAAWLAAGIIIDDFRVGPELVADPIEIKTSVFCRLHIE